MNENLTRKINELESQLQTTKATYGMQVVKLECNRAELEEKLERLDSNLNSTNQELASTQEAYAATSQARDKLIAQLAESQEAFACSMEEKSQLHNRFEREQESLREATEQLNKAREEIVELQNKFNGKICYFTCFVSIHKICCCIFLMFSFLNITLQMLKLWLLRAYFASKKILKPRSRSC